MSRVLVAMSGGVDSSVAALLLQAAGHDCAGVTMRLFDRTPGMNAPGINTPGTSAPGINTPGTSMPGTSMPGTSMPGTSMPGTSAPGTSAPECDWQSPDIQDAAAVCAALGIEHHVLDLREQFAQTVIAAFVEGYVSGQTPNPCIFCNRAMKFGTLLDAAHGLGFDYLATGHYARILYDGEKDEGGGEGKDEWKGVYRLLRAADLDKDQSYVLYQLGQAELAQLLFPLGGLAKQAVRALATDAGLPTAQKSESQDICFVPDGDYRAFIRRYLDAGILSPGEIVDMDGRVLGQHQGIVGYTIGQRHGLGVAVGHPLYVTSIDAVTNRIVVGEEVQLYHRKALLHSFNAAVPGKLESVMMVTAKHRYRSPEQPARLVQFDDGRFEVQFDQPQKALTPGQSVACYQGEELVAGGIIAEVRG